MKCEEYQTLIEEYFDGELDQHTAGLVSIHIERCLSCSTDLEQLAWENRAYQSYERGIDASPALWNKVHNRLVVEDSVKLELPVQRWQVGFSNLLAVRFSGPVSAVLVLAAILGTIAVMRYVERKQPSIQLAVVPEGRTDGPPSSAATDDVEQPKRNEDVASSSNGREAAPRVRAAMASGPLTLGRNPANAKTPAQLVRDAEKNYLSAIAILSRDVEKHPSELDSETRAKLDGALASIDRTILATREAVRKDPSDPLVVQYMLTAYAKKVDVLKEMTDY